LFFLVPKDFTGCLSLPFIDLPQGRVPGCIYLGIFLHIYNASHFDEKSVIPSKVRYRLSSGQKFWRHHGLKTFPCKESLKEAPFDLPRIPAAYISSDYVFPTVQFSMIQKFESPFVSPIHPINFH